MSKIKHLNTQVNIIIAIVALLIFSMQIIFFMYVTNIVGEQNRTLLDSVSSQITSIVNNKLTNLKKIQNVLLDSEEVSDYLKNIGEFGKKKHSMELAGEVKAIQNFNTDIMYMMIYDLDGEMRSFTNNILAPEEVAMDKIFNEYKNSDNYSKDYYYVFFTLEMNSNQQTYIACLSPNLEYNYNSMEWVKLGTSVVCSKINIKSTVRDIKQWKNLKLDLSDGKNEISLLKPVGIKVDKPLEAKANITDTNWDLNIEIYLDSRGNIFSMIKYIIFFETLIIMLIIWSIRVIMNKNINIPIKKIANYLDDYNLNSQQYLLELNVKTDIGIISHHINDMLIKNKDITRKIVKTQQKLYEIEIEKNNAVLYALQNQVNPHFMYNSLECVRSIACVHNVGPIVDISTAISNIMRYTLDSNNLVTVNEEIDIIKQYLKIMEIRFPNKFVFNFDIDHSVLDEPIIKMILQPIVENAFNHGLFYHKKKGILSISGKMFNDVIEFVVEDNGKGIEPNLLEEITNKMAVQDNSWHNEKGGIGLCNIDNRMKMNYGKEYGIKIETKVGEFTRIIVRFKKKLK